MLRSCSSSNAGVWSYGPNALANWTEARVLESSRSGTIVSRFLCVRIRSGQREEASDPLAVPSRTVLGAGSGELKTIARSRAHDDASSVPT